MLVILIFFGVILAVGVAILAYNIYTCFELLEEFSRKTPAEIFMEEYHKVKQERINFYANEN